MEVSTSISNDSSLGNHGQPVHISCIVHFCFVGDLMMAIYISSTIYESQHHRELRLGCFLNHLTHMLLTCKFGENRKQRYVYCAILNSIAKVAGIIKFDLHAEPEISGKKQLEGGGNVRGIFDLGPGRFGSEAIFVPKEPGVSGEEDDGYLIFFVHDENTGYSLSFPSLPINCSMRVCCMLVAVV